MTATPMPLCVLERLASRPSRASAAAIGHHFVLNGALPAMGLRGLDALAAMPCDWAVAILEQTIEDPTRKPGVRRHALRKGAEMLAQAIQRGYAGLTMWDCHQLAKEVNDDLNDRARFCDTSRSEGPRGLKPAALPCCTIAHGNLAAHATEAEECQALTELCNHLSQAIADGLFENLPDF